MINTGNPYIPEKFRILKVFRETKDTSTFRIECRTKNMPGQFFQAALLGIGECPISICSHSDSHVELCARNVGNVTKAMHGMKPGDHVWLRGPYGNGYPMHELYGKDVLLIGGGTGTAPLRGALEYIGKNRKAFGRISIFFGFRNYESILFKRNFNEWRKNFNFNFTLDCDTKKAKCNIGAVTALIDRANINKDAAALICGPPVMIKFVMQSLMNKGMKEENVYISFERMMSCGIGKCGHCEIGGKYVCRHGPVFRYDKAKNMMD